MRPDRVATCRVVRWTPFAQPVRFRGCDDLLAALRSIVHGWDEREIDPARAACPALRVSRARRGYRRVSTRLDRPSRARGKERRTLVEALCGLHGELLDWYAEAHPRHLFLHGAAVRIGGRLVVFPALAKAGKSTLSVQLAAAGHTVWTDDVLPVDLRTGRGLALGIVPRLRPPLPRGLGAATRAFVQRRAGPRRTNRFYVRLRRGECAPFGVEAPIGGVVLLERVPGARARIEPIARADALEALILQNYTRDRPAKAILDVLARVVERASCYRLQYARGAAAVAWLERTFGASPSRKAL
jgi:hypothetical protein